jgi:GDP-L-fucose synthase
MVGYALQRIVPEALFISSKDFNLEDAQATDKMFELHKPHYVVHLAAKVGGVKANTDYIGELYLKNNRINTNVLESARVHNTEKVVSLLSTCVYPDDAIYPLTENQFHNGPPHSSNYGYAYAKRMIDVQSRAYRDQYGCNFITAIPNNLFGENDNYHLEDSHVLPAIIRKMYEATIKGTPVHLWGDGSPLREFTYSSDVGRALLLLLDDYNDREPINIGNTEEVSIRELAEEIASIVGFDGEIIWQADQPAGQYRKPSSNSKFQEKFNMSYTSFSTALKNSCDWFIENYPNVRGVS